MDADKVQILDPVGFGLGPVTAQAGIAHCIKTAANSLHMVYEFVQENGTGVHVMLDIELAVEKNALSWCIEGFHTARPLAELLLQLGRLELVNLGICIGHRISPNIMNCNE
jgi:hypothetical protein